MLFLLLRFGLLSCSRIDNDVFPAGRRLDIVQRFGLVFQISIVSDVERIREVRKIAGRRVDLI